MKINILKSIILQFRYFLFQPLIFLIFLIIIFIILFSSPFNLIDTEEIQFMCFLLFSMTLLFMYQKYEKHRKYFSKGSLLCEERDMGKIFKLIGIGLVIDVIFVLLIYAFFFSSSNIILKYIAFFYIIKIFLNYLYSVLVIDKTEYSRGVYQKNIKK